jgi:hypothetical protein
MQEFVVVTCKVGQAHGYEQTGKEAKEKGGKTHPDGEHGNDKRVVGFRPKVVPDPRVCLFHRLDRLLRCVYQHLGSSCSSNATEHLPRTFLAVDTRVRVLCLEKVEDPIVVDRPAV